MSIQPHIVAELPGLRLQAESLMLDTLTAYEPTGVAKAPDGMESMSYEPRGTTPGKIQGRGGAGQSDTLVRTVNVGGVDRPVVNAGLHIPIDATAPVGGPVGMGWEYELTELGPLTPPELLGSRWLVIDSPAKSFATARRLDVVRLS